jgi:hypothetical protein
MKESLKNLTDEEVDDLNDQDFVVWFLEENKNLIKRYVNKRLIPNRYAPSDVRAYIAERILDILSKRRAKDQAIREPRLYFKKLIDFYCIEYQRMHGYIYGMPKRPRCPEAEAEISQYGFIYFPTDEENSVESLPQLGYIDARLDNTESYATAEYQVHGTETDIESTVWLKLMTMVLPEDQEVLSCIFRRNMSVPEVSKHLRIAISTAYARKERGLKAISGTLTSFIDLDQERWRVINEIHEVEPERVDIQQFYNNIFAVSDSPATSSEVSSS